MKNLKKVVFATIALVGLQSFAQNNQDSPYLVPSNENKTQLIAYEKNDTENNTKDYLKKSKATNVQFSPDGKYVSYTGKDENGKQRVYVQDIITEKITKTIEGKEEAIKGYGWLTNEKLAYSIDEVENNNIYSVSLDGSTTEDLTAIKRAKVTILSLLKEDKEHIIIQMDKKNSKTFEPYKLNIVTGALEPLFKK